MKPDKICRVCGADFIHGGSIFYCSDEAHHGHLMYWWVSRVNGDPSFHLRVKDKQISIWAFDNSTQFFLVDSNSSLTKVSKLPYQLSPQDLLKNDIERNIETVFNFL